MSVERRANVGEIRNAPAPTKRAAIVEPGPQNKKHKRSAKVGQHEKRKRREVVELLPFPTHRRSSSLLGSTWQA
jgi:hypothetical protein